MSGLLKDFLRDTMREILVEVLKEQQANTEANLGPATTIEGESWVAPSVFKVASGFLHAGKSVVGAGGWVVKTVGTDNCKMLAVLGACVAYNYREKWFAYLPRLRGKQVTVEEAAPAIYPDAGGPESLAQGSEIRAITSGLPKCMAKVAQKVESDGKMVYRSIGNCVRVGSKIFLPKHLLENGPAYILSTIEANFKADKNYRLEYEDDTDLVRCVDEDLLMVDLSEAEMSTLGLSKPTVGPVAVGTNVAVAAVTRALGQTSSGFVRGSSIFGVLSYSGSTTKGWSGGAYMQGIRLVGMHYYGGPNKGYAAAYLELLAKQPGKPEDSDDWFKEELEETGMNEFQLRAAGRLQDYGVDDVRYLDAKGRYHILEREVVNRGLSLQKKGKRRDYEDQEDTGPEGLIQPPSAFNVAVLGPEPDMIDGARAGNLKKGGKSSASSPVEEFARFSHKNQNDLMRLFKTHSVSSVLSMASNQNKQSQKTTVTP